MSLRHGREFLSIPGPSVTPDRVLTAMHRGAPNIYEGDFLDMTVGLYPDLQRVARTDARVAIYIANGHGAWEAALANTLSRGARALVLNSGRFGLGWAELAAAMGIETEMLSQGERAPVSPDALEARLRADRGHEIKAVLAVQVDTASSVHQEIAPLRAAIDAAGHPALLMVDAIACLGSVPMEMDAWGVDVLVAGSQKGLMTPPGLGFVWASEKAWARDGDLRTAYWDWRPRCEPEIFYQRFCGTAPTGLLFGLREALTMLLDEEGLENAWKRHRVLADAVRACVAGWAEGATNAGGLAFNVLDPARRADVVTTVLMQGADSDAFRAFCEAEEGLTLGVGLGDFDGRAFRIGHMGHLNPPMILGTLGAAEAALAALKIPHASGLGAAAASIGAHLAAA